MKFLTRTKVKWVAYALELLLLYIIQYTPNLLPSVWGTKPQLLLIFALSISIFDGEAAGMWYGLAAGLLMDLSSTYVFGFYGIIIMLLCYCCGALVVYLMRNNLVAYMLLCLASLVIFGLYQWLFIYALWGDKNTWYFLYAVVPPQIFYALLCSPVAYFFNRAIATYLAEDN